MASLITPKMIKCGSTEAPAIMRAPAMTVPAILTAPAVLRVPARESQHVIGTILTTMRAHVAKRLSDVKNPHPLPASFDHQGLKVVIGMPWLCPRSHLKTEKWTGGSRKDDTCKARIRCTVKLLECTISNQHALTRHDVNSMCMCSSALMSSSGQFSHM